MNDRTTRILLFVIASLLLLLVFQPLLPTTASAAPAHAPVKYKVVKVEHAEASAMQKILDKEGAEGWQLVAIENIEGHFIFKR